MESSVRTCSSAAVSTPPTSIAFTRTVGASSGAIALVIMGLSVLFFAITIVKMKHF